jgi:hypothetical protein
VPGASKKAKISKKKRPVFAAGTKQPNECSEDAKKRLADYLRQNSECQNPPQSYLEPSPTTGILSDLLGGNSLITISDDPNGCESVGALGVQYDNPMMTQMPYMAPMSPMSPMAPMMPSPDGMMYNNPGMMAQTPYMMPPMMSI